MPNPVVTLVTKGVPLLVKYGPKAVAAVTVLSKFIGDNPTIPGWFKRRLGDVPQRLSDNQRKRGEAAKIRGTLDIIRDVSSDARKADHRIDAKGYTARADRIELGVRLAETQERSVKKARLGKLKADTDALLAEVLDAVAGAEPTAADADDDAADDDAAVSKE